MFKKTLIGLLALGATLSATDEEVKKVDHSDSFFYVAGGIENDPLMPSEKGNSFSPMVTLGYRIKGDYLGLDLSASALYKHIKVMQPEANVYGLFYPMKDGLYLGAGVSMAEYSKGCEAEEGVVIQDIMRGMIGYEFKTDSGHKRFIQLTGSNKENVAVQVGFGF